MLPSRDVGIEMKINFDSTQGGSGVIYSLESKLFITREAYGLIEVTQEAHGLIRSLGRCRV